MSFSGYAMSLCCELFPVMSPRFGVDVGEQHNKPVWQFTVTGRAASTPISHMASRTGIGDKVRAKSAELNVGVDRPLNLKQIGPVSENLTFVVIDVASGKSKCALCVVEGRSHPPGTSYQLRLLGVPRFCNSGSVVAACQQTDAQHCQQPNQPYSHDLRSILGCMNTGYGDG